MPVPESNVFLADAEGAVAPYSHEEALDLIEAGYTPASHDQVQAFHAEQEKQAKFGGTAGELKAAGIGALQGISLGVGAPLAEKAGLWSPETRKGLEEVNPNAYLAGEVGGALAPALLTGGSSAGVGAAARATGSGLAATAGRAVTGAVERALVREGSGVAAGALAKAAAVGAGSAVEGAFWGTGQVVGEALLGDPQLTAERAVAEIGLSAALGGGLGSALGAAEVLVPAAVRGTSKAAGAVFGKAKGVVEEVAEKAAGEEHKVTARLILENHLKVDQLDKAVDGAADYLKWAKPDTAQFILDNAEAIAAVEKRVPGLTNTLSRANRDTAEMLLEYADSLLRDPADALRLAKRQAGAIQEVVDSVEEAKRLAFKTARPEEVETLLNKRFKGLPDEDVSNAAQDYRKSLRSAATKMENNPSEFSKSTAKLLEERFDHLGAQLAGAPPERVFVVLDDTKKWMDKHLIKWQASLKMLPSEDEQVARALRGNLKNLLEDEKIWGPAAARQAAFNNAASDYLEALRWMKKGRFNFMTEQLDAKTGEASWKVDPIKLETWFNQMAKAKGEARSEVFDNFLDKSKKMLAQVEETHRTAGTPGFDRAKLEELIAKTEAITKETTTTAKVTQTWNLLNSSNPWGANVIAQPSLEERIARSGLMMVSPFAAGLASTAKATYETFKDPAKMVRILSTVERLGQKTAAAVERGADLAVRGAVRGSEGMRGYAAHKMLEPKEVSDHQADPEALLDKLSKAVGPMSEAAPDAAQAVHTTVSRALAFLESKLPRPEPTGPLAGLRTPSASEMATYRRYAEAVEKPQRLLEQAAHGRVTPEAVEAVSTVYPELFAQMQNAVMDKIAEMKGIVPYQQRLALSLILGQDLDGSSLPPALAANQNALRTAELRKQTQSGAAPVGAANRVMTSTQASSQRTGG